MRRNPDGRATPWLGGGGLLGMLLGSWLFTLLSAQAKLLRPALSLLFLWPAIRMIWEGIQGFAGKGPAKKEGNVIPGSGWGMAVFGFVVGVATGVAGLGGGYALVPGMMGEGPGARGLSFAPPDGEKSDEKGVRRSADRPGKERAKQALEGG